MNVHLMPAPKPRTAGPLYMMLGALLFATLPGLSSAQAPSLKAPDQHPLVPTRTTIPIIGGRDTARILDPARVLGDIERIVAAEAGTKGKQDAPPRSRSVDYSGPRFGFTYLPQNAIDSLKAHKITVGNPITQFGWQFEREIVVTEQGPRVLNEWVFLAGGLESGAFLPSLTWLVGARSSGGSEIGVGPNVSVSGVGLAAALGVSIPTGGVRFPMNIAVAQSKGGIRVSFLTGFTIH